MGTEQRQNKSERVLFLLNECSGGNYMNFERANYKNYDIFFKAALVEP